MNNKNELQEAKLLYVGLTLALCVLAFFCGGIYAHSRSQAQMNAATQALEKQINELRAKNDSLNESLAAANRSLSELTDRIAGLDEVREEASDADASDVSIADDSDVAEGQDLGPSSSRSTYSMHSLAPTPIPTPALVSTSTWYNQYVSPTPTPTPYVYRSPSVAENGSYYGEISEKTGRPKTVHVEGYYRKDGTYVRGHYRSAPRR